MTTTKHMLSVQVKPGESYTVTGVSARARSDPAAIEKLLALIIAQARNDGMHEIHLGVDAQAHAPYLRYVRVAESPEAGSWDMTPPPLGTYNEIVKAVVRHTDFVADGRPIGLMTVEINRKPLTVAVEIASWQDIRLCLGPQDSCLG
jgi:hypothetical protein